MGALRPVGDPVVPRQSLEEDCWDAKGEFQNVYLNSGTAALALALQIARSKLSRNDARVILPAYGCPDLVSAAVHANCKISLVDVMPGTPFFDLDKLRESLDTDVVAIVGVHFLGYKDDLPSLKKLSAQYGCLLVEDSAQLIEMGAGQAHGDLIVHSFGRGKPGGALGGGVLRVRQSLSDMIPGDLKPVSNQFELRWPVMLALRAHKVLLTPTFYQLAISMRLGGIGETRYRPLETISRLSPARTAAGLAGICAWKGRSSSIADQLLRGIEKFSGKLTLLAHERLGGDARNLLRLPVVIEDEKLRNRVLERLCKRRLGATKLYGSPLNRIEGVPPLGHETPEATRFAGKLLTLPTHSDVNPHHVGEMMRIIDECVSQ